MEEELKNEEEAMWSNKTTAVSVLFQSHAHTPNDNKKKLGFYANL